MDEEDQIVDVWAHNLEEEFEKIRDVVEVYQYVSTDTEFPGVVAKPTTYREDYNYQTVKCNVDMLRIIQLGLSFADASGNPPPKVSTWQFNFKFDLKSDMYAQDSIELLKESGIDFELHQSQGIDLEHFGELIMSSGLVMNEDIIWVSFHGCYDFAYLLKLLTCKSLPSKESEFFDLLKHFFPTLYDIKYLLEKACINLGGRNSLSRISEYLNVKRIGPQHQAGSDSLVTLGTFFRLMNKYFKDNMKDCKHQGGVIYGLGKTASIPHVLQSSANSANRDKGEGQQISFDSGVANDDGVSKLRQFDRLNLLDFRNESSTVSWSPISKVVQPRSIDDKLVLDGTSQLQDNNLNLYNNIYTSRNVYSL
ncbi:CCR4-NOT transcription complex subunit 7/8 [Babesia microti strain RI]|uniref:poly(A)-specific ribonuclease n=1 Tax=Babesia microti (strain RI) TaxID=1133968 RepID=A0A1R4ABX1_BABMR|nr:CCR4-NOT transcription complex subunit 7/8 [Babesia microti strain RI]SJK86519.1 CCR4-NOT transcription complex subunit 7/8 [Babesia microti strain RI]|eukprot:XP_021338669.1 CCR4-NOT transcription complex subunit 7/8 [Babesia microti strain RI]